MNEARFKYEFEIVKKIIQTGTKEEQIKKYNELKKEIEEAKIDLESAKQDLDSGLSGVAKTDRQGDLKFDNQTIETLTPVFTFLEDYLLAMGTIILEENKQENKNSKK